MDVKLGLRLQESRNYGNRIRGKKFGSDNCITKAAIR